jgi:uncharacterized protein YjbI with pentapeptide repeats
MDPTVTAALIGAGAALIGVGGTVIVAVTSARNSRRTNQATIDAARADALLTLETAREAQYADRYSRALEQLGSDAQGIRIGGILALEGLALDSPRNHPTVMEVLTAYIREHAKGRAEDDRLPRADVQAALSVVGRRKADNDIRPIDLNNSDLRGADLTGANLTDANLAKVNLTHATLSMVNLTRANLWGADLSATSLTSSILVGAELVGANLADSLLADVNIDFAVLRNANLTDTSFISTDLTKTDLTYALCLGGSTAPEGWLKRGARLERVDESTEPTAPDTN